MPRKAQPARRDAGRPRGAPVVEAVLAETLAELGAVGLAGLSFERIARRAQVDKTTLYRRWPTREALVVAALEGVLADISLEIPDTGALRGDLLGLLGRVVAVVETPGGRALLRAAFDDTAAPLIAAMVAGRLATTTIHPAQALVDRALARGEWRAGVSPDLMFFGLVGAILHRALLEHAPLSDAWLADVVDLALLGVLPREVPVSRAVQGHTPTPAAG